MAVLRKNNKEEAVPNFIDGVNKKLTRRKAKQVLQCALK